MDPVLLQKSIRDNSEDLQNFMRDLNHWESDMKRKDKEIAQPSSQEILPPVRSRVKKQRKTESKAATKTGKEKAATSSEKPRRLLSSDYSSWDKFDVEKACEAIDNENEKCDAENGEEEEDLSDEQTEEERLHDRALYEKELGNAYVKKGKWAEAIKSYSKAIEYYDKDAIFYANRALCYLKTNQLQLAEDDCTRSLKLDSSYVKSYQRRAAVRIELKKYEDARSDLKSVLKFEPNNVQAKKDLGNLPESKKPSSESKTPAISKTRLGTVESSLKSDAIKPIPEESPVKQTECHNIQPWGEVDPSRIVHPINKPPHLRSKKPLKRINIINVDDITSNEKEDCRIENIRETEESTKLSNIVSLSKETCITTPSPSINNERPLPSGSLKTENVKNKIQDEKNYAVNQAPLNGSMSGVVPPPPKTSVQFHLVWNKFKTNPEQLYLYLRQIDGNQLPFIFQDSLESNTFSSIISVLSSEFIKHSTPVYRYLDGLSSVRRFGSLALFMTKHDKEGVTKLVNYCTANQEISEKEAMNLRKKYELPYC